jgi:nitroreductase
MDFETVVSARRSVRKYLSDPVPPEVVSRALDHALLAPNSSNLQPWQFYWVRSPEKKAELAQACFSQPAATTAAHLVVAVADYGTWRKHNDWMREELRKLPRAPLSALNYYEKLIPFTFLHDPFGLISSIKWIVFSILGFFKPTPRGPKCPREYQEVAVKTTALACEHFLLSVVDKGYAGCPMEGFDDTRVRRLLSLPRRARVVMVMSVGLADPKGVYGPRMRVEKSGVCFEI